MANGSKSSQATIRSSATIARAMTMTQQTTATALGSRRPCRRFDRETTGPAEPSSTGEAYDVARHRRPRPVGNASQPVRLPRPLGVGPRAGTGGVVRRWSMVVEGNWGGRGELWRSGDVEVAGGLRLAGCGLPGTSGRSLVPQEVVDALVAQSAVHLTRLEVGPVAPTHFGHGTAPSASVTDAVPLPVKLELVGALRWTRHVPAPFAACVVTWIRMGATSANSENSASNPPS